MNNNIKQDRHVKINNLRNDIKLINKSIEIDKETIKLLKNGEITNYHIKEVAKLTKSVKERIDKKVELELKINLYLSGKLDDEIKKEQLSYLSKLDSIKTLKKQKKDKESLLKSKASAKSKSYYHTIRQEDRKSKYSLKNQIRSFRWIQKTVDSLPHYMESKIKNTTADKGYLFKNLYLFGWKKERNDNRRNRKNKMGKKRNIEKNKETVIFDKKRGNILEIHEWTNDYYRLYSKKGKDKRELISERRRDIDL